MVMRFLFVDKKENNIVIELYFYSTRGADEFWTRASQINKSLLCANKSHDMCRYVFEFILHLHSNLVLCLFLLFFPIHLFLLSQFRDLKQMTSKILTSSISSSQEKSNFICYNYTVGKFNQYFEIKTYQNIK